MTRRRAVAAGATVAVIVVVVAAIVAGSGGGGGKSGVGGARPGAPLVGVNVNYVFNTLAYKPAQQLAILRTLAATGVDTARGDALWELTEPARGHFTPSFDDDIAGTLAAAGLRWLPIVDYAPGWAAQMPSLMHSPPADPATYAAFGAWLAHRYGRGGTFWSSHPGLTARPVTTYEIWNEPDVPLFWAPRPDPAALARLYLAARAAIHGVDPQAVVVVGGLTKAPSTLPAMVAAEPSLRSELDGVAIHPYGTSTAASVLAAVGQARATLDRLDLARVPLYATEFGWVTSPSRANHYVPESARPALIRATVDALAHTDCDLAGEVLYTWITPQGNVEDPEQWYGIEPVADAVRGALSPDASALRAAVASARAAGPQLRLCG
jgi:hypothetical protein